MRHAIWHLHRLYSSQKWSSTCSLYKLFKETWFDVRISMSLKAATFSANHKIRASANVDQQLRSGTLHQLEGIKTQAILRWINKFWKWVDHQRHLLLRAVYLLGWIQPDSNWLSHSKPITGDLQFHKMTETGCVGTQLAKSIIVIPTHHCQCYGWHCSSLQPLSLITDHES